jgi:hypothetical protein
MLREEDKSRREDQHHSLIIEMERQTTEWIEKGSAGLQPVNVQGRVASFRITVVLLTMLHVLQTCIISFHTLRTTENLVLYSNSYFFFILEILCIICYYECSYWYQRYWETFYLTEGSRLICGTDRQLTEVHRRRQMARERHEIWQSMHLPGVLPQFLHILPYVVGVWFFGLTQHFEMLTLRASLWVSGMHVLLYAIQHWMYISI